MKRTLILFLILSFIFTASVFASDFSFLDGMTLSELQELQTAVEKRIEQEKAKDGADLGNLGMWTLRYYVDEFNNPTEEGYITNSSWIEGTFSNSATSGSELNVRFLIDKDDLSIMLYEYGNKQVNNGSRSDDVYHVAMMDSSGKKYSLTGTIYAYSDRLFFNSADKQTILDALSANGKVSFSIVDSKKSIDKYIFTIPDSSYFVNAYALLNSEQL